MKAADASHFFHLLSLEGEALAPPPPTMTYREKLAFLAAKTKGEEMTPPTIEDYRRAKNERMKDLRREYAKPVLAAENAAKIIQKADELGRVGGWDTIDYPVAVAYLALAEEIGRLRNQNERLIKSGMALLMQITPCQPTNDKSTVPNHRIKSLADAIAQQKQAGGE